MKTRLGISTRAMAALVCFLGLFGGYISTLLVVGYVMLAESDEFLKKTALKTLADMVAFSLLGVVIGYIPDAVELISRIVGLFGGAFTLTFLNKLVSLISFVLGVLESVILLVMGLKALKGQSLPIGCIDHVLAHNFGAKVCPNCGAHLPDGTVFCPNCGRKIEE